MTSIMAFSRAICYIWMTLLGRMLRARPGKFFMMTFMTVLLITMKKLIVVILDSQLPPN